MEIAAEGIEKLLIQVYGIYEKYEEIDRALGLTFNVFEIINLTTQEVRLHSNFIAELLNVNGSHGQGNVFLDLFVKRFEIGIDTKTAKVEVEKYIGEKTETSGGIIDIFVSDRNGNSFTIENKIYAGDQDNQIKRYYNYSKKNFNNFKIFYLTLDGHEPDESSYGDLKPGEDFKLISYQEDIISWLEDCKKQAVDLPLIREGISHYINLLKKLTGQSNNSVMKKEIVDVINSSEENVRAAFFIAENLNYVKAEIQWNFWEKLKGELREKGLKITENLSKNDVENFYIGSRGKYYYGLNINICEQLGLFFSVSIDNVGIYFGFVRNAEKNDKELDIKDKKLLAIVKSIHKNYESNNLWIGWRLPNRGLNFYDTNLLIRLADKSEMEGTVANLVEEIINDINLFKEKVKQANLI